MSVGGLLSLWKSIKVDRFWKIQAVNEVNFLWKTRAQISFGSWELISNLDHHDNTIEHIGLFQLQILKINSNNEMPFYFWKKQGMYKNTNRLKNDRTIFEIPALLSCEPRNPE